MPAQFNINSQFSHLYNTEKLSTKFFRWLFDVDLVFAEHQARISGSHHQPVGICSALGSVLSDLKNKAENMGWFFCWLMEIDLLIVKYEELLKDAIKIRNDKFFENLCEARKTGSSIVEGKKSSGKHLEKHLANKAKFIQELPQPIFAIMPSDKAINYFPGPFCSPPIRYVYARVSGGKPNTYANLLAEKKEIYRERNRLQQDIPPRYDAGVDLDWLPPRYANSLQSTKFQRWSDHVDDCDARGSYVGSELEEQAKRACHVAINERGDPIVSFMRS